MKRDQNKYRRKSIRLPGFDYARPGAYFVTICTQGKLPLFGRVVQDSMDLNRYGEVVRRCWLGLPSHYRGMELDEWVIMPNHVHGIVLLTDRVGMGVKPTSSLAQGAGCEPAPTRFHGLPEIIRGFKTFSSRRLNQMRGSRGARLWQRGYYEHIIRDEADLDRVREYIVSNPLRWHLDEENPDLRRAGAQIRRS